MPGIRSDPSAALSYDGLLPATHSALSGSMAC